MCELTILMPCLNEAETLEICIKKARHFLEINKISGEILVADNGSTDGSDRIAAEAGAKITRVREKGYGSALIAGIKASSGKYVIMGDADDSYDFLNLADFINKLREGFDLVMGNRFAGGIHPGAMPPMHRYFGNPALSFIGRLFFKSHVKDFNCGLRGFNRESILNLGLVTPGMEFATEMVVKATILKYRIAEVPTTLSQDGRNRAPHLQTWRDGWRQLVFLLMYSPRWLFFYPSLIFFLLSVGSLLILLPGTLYIKKIGLDIHTLTIAGSMAVLSYQLFLYAVFIRVYSLNQGLYPAKPKHKFFATLFTLERGIAAGAGFLLGGVIMLMILLNSWSRIGYGPIHNPGETFRLLIPSITLISIGIQTIFSSFLLRILGIHTKYTIPDEKN